MQAMAAHAPPLPDNVLREILVRLPLRSICRSRAVCTAWRAAAAHPSFDRALAERPPAVAKVTPGEVVVGRNFGSALNFDLFGGRWSSEARRNAGPPCRTVAFSESRAHAFLCRVRDSWDGVLCLRPPAGAKEYVLWNPLSEASVTVPAPSGGGRLIGGYAHPETRRFHLLHSTDEAVPGRDGLLGPVTFRILRVGDGDSTWRELPPPAQDSASIFMKSDRDRPVRVGGNLYWLVQSATSRVALLVFDTAEEKFRLMAAPDRPGLRLETARTVLSGGKLCVLALATPPSAGTMDMWVLDSCSDGRARWRLRETIRMVQSDGADLSPTFVAVGAQLLHMTRRRTRSATAHARRSQPCGVTPHLAMDAVTTRPTAPLLSAHGAPSRIDWVPSCIL